jgi:hypothetical protein
MIFKTFDLIINKIEKLFFQSIFNKRAFFHIFDDFCYYFGNLFKLIQIFLLYFSTISL